MKNLRHPRKLIFNLSLTAGTAALAMAGLLILVVPQPVQAQTFKVLHSFTFDGPDGTAPYGGLTLDEAGNLYGTAFKGGYLGGACAPIGGCGTVYQLKHRGSGWIFNILFSFNFENGLNPAARVVFGPNGTLYGNTGAGGSGVCGSSGCGTVFNLRPLPTACKSALCPWTETVIYDFTGPPDGANGSLGDLIFKEGNIYGTTEGGGSGCGGGHGCGTVYELTPSGGGWTESILYNFLGIDGDGATPASGVIFDSAGNLFGTTTAYGAGTGGTVYELSPSGPGWTEKVLYSFQNGKDGDQPVAGLIFDPSGNLYGATRDGGTGGGGTIFELSPSGDSWTFTVLYSFTGNGFCGPWASLAFDTSGNLYGTTVCDGAYGYGSVFRLTPTPTPPWTYTSLHDFTNGSDGSSPLSNVVFDANGNLYGTTGSGGTQNVGVVWEITP